MWFEICTWVVREYVIQPALCGKLGLNNQFLINYL